MPRNPSGEYSLPASYLAVDGQTARADQHNEPLEDLRDALNEPTPIAKGGHGATTAAAGLSALGGMPKSGGEFTGPVKLKEIQQTAVPLSGTAPEIDLEAGTVFSLTTEGNTTLSFANPAASGTASVLTVVITSGGAHSVTFPGAVRNPPTGPANGETSVYVFLTVDGGVSWEHVNAQGGGVDIQEFTSSGTWVKPAGATVVQVYAVGPGAGGANDTGTVTSNGGAGGEGLLFTVLASSLGATEPIAIGAGGAGAPNGSNANGSDGGNTTFGTVTAFGGRGGLRGTSLSTTGRDSSDGGGFATYSASYGVSNRPSVYGGGAGGTAGQSGKSSEFAGNGGDGDSTAATKAGDGVTPGGGGGGSTNDGGGGDGGDGYCRVISW